MLLFNTRSRVVALSKPLDRSTQTALFVGAHTTQRSGSIWWMCLARVVLPVPACPLMTNDLRVSLDRKCSLCDGL